jgi:hypothetical protein
MGKYEYNIVPRTLLSETKVVKEEVEEFIHFKWEMRNAHSTPVPKIYELQRKWGHIVQNGDGKIYLRVFYYSKAITSKNGYDFADYLLDEYLSHVRNRKIEKILCEL